MKFLKQVIAITTCLLFLLTIPGSALAAGPLVTNIHVQALPSEWRSVIVHDGKEETIFETLTFNINPVIAWNFAVVTAVPAKPTVEIISDDLITKFEKITQKNISKNNLLEKILYFDADVTDGGMQNLYVRQIDVMKYWIIEPSQGSDALYSKLSEYGYVMPKSGKHVINEYVDKGWYFVIWEVNGNHLQTTAEESLTVPGARTFPIKIRFESNEIVYPLKLAKIQPDYDSEVSPLSFEYGSSAENVLGVKDEKVEDLLAIQSQNEYPQLPFDYAHQKIELFVITDDKMRADKFTTTYASKLLKNTIEFKDTKSAYFELPKDKMFLTRMHAFVPTIQLEDVPITKARNNQTVNSKPSVSSRLLIFGSPLAFVLVVLYLRAQGRSRKNTLNTE